MSFGVGLFECVIIISTTHSLHLPNTQTHTNKDTAPSQSFVCSKTTQLYRTPADAD